MSFILRSCPKLKEHHQVFELVIGNRLFRPRPSGKNSAERYHLARMLATSPYTKPYPARLMDFFRRGREFDRFFNDETKGLLTRYRIGVAHNIHLTVLRFSAAPEPLSRILSVYNMYDPELDEMLSAMLQILPEDRPSAKELLQFAWLNEEE